ncbi:MAG: hypothetical protein R2867_24480 [Caldilineaceae bacterium]
MTRVQISIVRWEAVWKSARPVRKRLFGNPGRSGVEVADLQLLGVLESLFTVNARAGHEIVFVYDGRFADEALYAQSMIKVTEDNGVVVCASWRTLDSFDEQHRLVPEALLPLLTPV